MAYTHIHIYTNTNTRTYIETRTQNVIRKRMSSVTKSSLSACHCLRPIRSGRIAHGQELCAAPTCNRPRAICPNDFIELPQLPFYVRARVDSNSIGITYEMTKK